MISGFYYRANGLWGPIVLLVLGARCAAAAGENAPATVDFSHTVVPILKAHCVECHGARRHEGDFSINTREEILKVDVVVPGKSAESRLIDLVTSNDKEERMPKGKPPLSAGDVKSLRDWIDGGMPWEAGFTFAIREYEPPLRPRRPELPPAVAGRTKADQRVVVSGARDEHAV
jgi:hypothetical protein